MDPIISVMRAMTDAVSNAKLSTLSMAAYRQARVRGGEEGMDRAAVGRAADSMPSAILASLASQQALVKANAEAQAQEGLRWQRLQEEAQAAARALSRLKVRQALKQAREEAREEKQDEARNAAPGEHGEVDSGEGPSAQVDARRSGRKAARSGGAPPRGSEAPEKGVLYTNTGEVKPKAASKKVSVTA